MYGPALYPNITPYGAFRNSGTLGKTSLFVLRATGGTSGNGLITDRGPVMDYSVAATTEASGFSTQYPGFCLSSSAAGIAFNKPFRVLIQGVSMSNQAQTTGRIIFGGTSTSVITAIDSTDWGIELAFVSGSVLVRAVKAAAGTVLVTTGVAFTSGDSLEVVHDPVLGLTLLEGSMPGSMAVALIIAKDTDNYPVENSTDSTIRVGIIRAGGSDTTGRDFYASKVWPIMYNGG